MEPIYISGPHGVGKTTLLNALLAETGVLSLRRSGTEVQSDQPILRVFLSSSAYCNDLVRHRRQCDQRQGLGDRCIVDSVAYLIAFHALGWVSVDEYDFMFSKVSSLMADIGWPRRVIVLSGDQDFIRRNILSRKHAKGFRQSDPELLEALIAAYDQLGSGAWDMDTSGWLFSGNYETPDFFEQCFQYLSKSGPVQCA